jgi:hypothetical protein
VFSPIVHTHGPAIAGGIDPLDHDIWLPADRPFMDAATGLIFLKAISWEQSYGMRIEREHFLATNKPVVEMQPGIVPAELPRLRLEPYDERRIGTTAPPAVGDNRNSAHISMSCLRRSSSDER